MRVHIYRAGTPVQVMSAISDREDLRGFVIIGMDEPIHYEPDTIMLLVDPISWSMSNGHGTLAHLMIFDGQVGWCVRSRLKFLTGPGPRPDICVK